MKFIFFILSIFLLSTHLKAEDVSLPKTKKYSQTGGVEITLETFNFGKKYHFAPHLPCVDCYVKATKLVQGKQLYSVIYHLDEDGFRTTPHSYNPEKQKHFFVIDGSVAFSEGLDDKDSLIEQIGLRSKKFNAYDVGFLGHGPQQNWLVFHNRNLQTKIKEKRGSAILISHDEDIRRFVGTSNHLIYAAHFPHIVETSTGVFSEEGTFESDGTFKQRMLIKFCVPFTFCRNQMIKNSTLTDAEEIALSGRMFNDIEKMYRSQFNVENFVILWTGSDYALEVLKKNVHAKIIKANYERFDSNHPSAHGVDQIVSLLIKEKILE
jgi:hypothetical protein